LLRAYRGQCFDALGGGILTLQGERLSEQEVALLDSAEGQRTLVLEYARFFEGRPEAARDVG